MNFSFTKNTETKFQPNENIKEFLVNGKLIDWDKLLAHLLSQNPQSYEASNEAGELKMPAFVKRMIEKKRAQGETVEMPDFVKKMLEKKGAKVNTSTESLSAKNKILSGNNKAIEGGIFDEKADWQAKITESPLHNAFAQKKSAHASGDAVIVPDHLLDNFSECLSNVSRIGKSTVYINVPFCQTRCTYCMFYITSYKKEESKRYADTLIKELHLWADKACVGTEPIHAVYFGGGTPTALEAEDLERILKEVHLTLPLANDVEITIEGRLSYFGPKKIEACLRGGANRFSLGVQTFDTEIRRSVQRLSDTDELIKGLEQLCSYDNAAVVIDLIYGLPGQTMETWNRDLEIATSTGIHGLDLYQMLVFPGSPLDRLAKANKIAPLPTNYQRADMYKYGVDFLKNHCWNQLSVSHFSSDTRERNLYNRLTKSDADTLAFGPGAGGKIQGASFMQIRDYEDWIENVQKGKKPLAVITIPKNHWRLYKTLGESMELGFVDWLKIKEKYHIDVRAYAKDVLKQWEEAGLWHNDDRFSKLTLAGRFWAVTMVQHLINYLSPKLENID